MRATSSRRSVSSEDFALKTLFEDAVTRFADAPASQLDLPIAHWTVPSDRRLPFALLDRTVRQITMASYDNLLATPGLGRKKFASLLMLLQRASEAAEAATEPVATALVDSIALHPDVFDADLVSQIMWAEWQGTVRRHHLESESLGRLAPSLQTLPTVIWSKQLGEYLRYTIDELRSLKTHGDKRVTAVLEVFHVVHGILAGSTRSTRVLAQLTPAFVPPIEHWLFRVLASEEALSAQDVRQHLVLPLLNQIERDAGEIVHRLAAGRLGIEAFPEGVRDQSLDLGVTRARIYQLLETCGDVMRVRWPAGRWMFRLLIQKVKSQAGDSEALELLESLQWLLYPTRRAHAVMETAIA
ncbi:MAG TPA: hypothetical protein VMM76_10220 [Pirellulaceae bacterium]|nr:hypothetical protein [Pirellulaceae bacterium]